MGPTILNFSTCEGCRFFKSETQEASYPDQGMKYINNYCECPQPRISLNTFDNKFGLQITPQNCPLK